MIWQVLSLLFCSVWIITIVYMQRSLARMPLLRLVANNESSDDQLWPTLSIIVPACNEAENLEAALASLLKLDYPVFEVIVINDRSTDSTGAIINRLAKTDRRIKPFHVESLPEGWLGKVHAMHVGVQRAEGEWLLFTDADVLFDPEILRLAMTYARQQRVNHLACVPEIAISKSFWLDVAIRAFFAMFSVSTRLLSVNRIGTRRPVGIGAFNLVETDAFRQTPGFEWLRMEPADDVGLGLMLKNAGSSTHLVHGDGLLSVSWYSNVKEMIRGLEKNGFGPGANYRYWKQIVIVIALWGMALIPLLNILAGIALPDAFLLTTGAVAFLSTIAVALMMPRKSGREIFCYLLLPAGVLLLSYILLRAAWLCFKNDGIDWRGTHYSVAELRSGQRVRF